MTKTLNDIVQEQLAEFDALAVAFELERAAHTALKSFLALSMRKAVEAHWEALEVKPFAQSHTNNEWEEGSRQAEEEIVESHDAFMQQSEEHDFDGCGTSVLFPNEKCKDGIQWIMFSLF